MPLAKGVHIHRQITETKQESVLVFDLGLVLKQQASYHAGLIFSANTPYQMSSRPTIETYRRKSFNTKKKEAIIAYGGRFDNSVAHY
jgi:hypothetical protein